jgi:hypothetical protein
MPLTVRAKGVSLSTATNWAFNFLVGETTPFLQELIGWRLYLMHGFYCICSFIVGMLGVCHQSIPYAYSSYFQCISVSSRDFDIDINPDCMTVYPETKGVPLEEMDAVFGEGSSTLRCKTPLNPYYYFYRRTTRQRIGKSLSRFECDPDESPCNQPAKAETRKPKLGRLVAF